MRYGGTRRRKGELTVNTNINLRRHASPGPYLTGLGLKCPSLLNQLQPWSCALHASAPRW